MTADEARNAARHEAQTALGHQAARLSVEIERYANAAFSAVKLREEWEALGSPTAALDGRGAVINHPMLKGIRDAERHASQMADALGIQPRKVTGRRSGESPAEDRQPRLKRAA